MVGRMRTPSCRRLLRWIRIGKYVDEKVLIPDEEWLRRQKMFREALKELHNKILEEREAHKEAKVARQEYLNFTKYNLKLKEKKKKFLLNSEKKSLIDTLAKSSAIINSGLVHKIANDTDMAYADYGEVEAQAAQEEMDVC